MIEEVKNLRVKIDGLAQLTENVKHDYIDPKNSKEIEKAVDNLYLAKAWLGKVLGELGNDNPYGSGYKTKEDIEPTADVAKEVEDFPLDNKDWGEDIDKIYHVEKVDWLRQEINLIIEAICKPPFTTPDNSREFYIARTNTYNYLCEARFWLGWELSRIRDAK